MPTIRTYGAPALSLNPTETGIQATVQAAGRIARTYDQVAADTKSVGDEFARDVGSSIQAAGGVAVKYAESREINHGAAAFAQLNDGLAQSWNDTAKTADPNDPTVRQRWAESTLEPALQKYREGFWTEGGQQFAERHIESLRNHMFEKTSADMSSLAASAVAVNMRTTSNSLSNTAMTDPSAVGNLLGTADSLVDGMIAAAPNLKGAAAAKARMELTQKMKEEIVKSGAVGAIMKSGNPEATAQEWGAKYPEYINGQEMKMLAANARQQIRAARMDAAYLDRLRDAEAQDASDKRVDQYMKDLYSDDPQKAGSISARGIVNDPTLTRRDKDYMLTRVERAFKPETDAQRSAETTKDLMTRMQAPEGTPDRVTDIQPIYDAFKRGDLTRTDTDWLVKQFRENRTPEGQRLSDSKGELIKAVSASITSSNPMQGKMDPSGDMMKYRFMKDLDAEVDAYRKAGKNPYDLFDPAKPDFFGRPENVSRYQVPLSESVKNATQRLRSGSMNLTGPGRAVTGVEMTPAPKSEPRKPGESAADYLKRIGK